MSHPPPVAAAARRPAKIALENVYKVFGANASRAIPLLKGGASKRDVQDELGKRLQLQESKTGSLQSKAAGYDKDAEVFEPLTVAYRGDGV